MFKFLFNENEASRLYRPIACDDVNDLFLCDDDMMAYSFMCNPASGWDSKMVNSISLLLNDDMPEDSIMSFSLIASPDIRPFIKNAYNLRNNCTNKLHRSALETQLGHFWQGTRFPIETNQQSRVRNFALIVTVKVPLEDGEFGEVEEEKLLRLKGITKQRLSAAYLSPSSISSKMYINLMQSVMNPHESAQWRHVDAVEVDEDKVLNEQISEPSQSVTKKTNGVVIGSGDDKTYVRMLTVRQFPQRTSIGAAFNWVGDPFEGQGSTVTTPLIITVNIAYPNKLKTQGAIASKKNRYLKMKSGAIARFVPKISTMFKELDDLSQETEKTRAIKVSVSAAVFGASRSEADNACVDLQTNMKQAGLYMVDEDSFSIPSLICALPMGACNDAVKKSLRFRTMATKHVMPILPIFGEWKGTPTPTMNFISRTGQIMNFCLFDSETNYNTIIYAESGAGKSFLTNEIIRSYMSTNAKVWAIDAGDSYKKLSRCFDGTFTAFTDDADLSFNPFSMIPEDDPKAFNDALEMLAGMIIAMAFTTTQPSDLQASEVERIVAKVWHEKGQHALIDDVANACLTESDQRIRDIGTQLYSFTTKGQFGKYFDKPHNVVFTGDFNVLELDGLSKTPRLQAVVLFMLMIQISQEMYEQFKQDRDVKRIVIIDEAWDLLANSTAVSSFMEKGFRRFRKYNGAGIVVTQSILDLAKSEAGRAIAENAANSLILRQKDSSITNAEKNDLMSLPKAGYRLLRKVTTVKNSYSEIFLSTNRGMGIGRLIVDPMRVMMFSTTAEDNKQIEAKEAQGYALEDALIEVARDRNMFRFDMSKPSFLDYKPNISRTDFKVRSYLLPISE